MGNVTSPAAVLLITAAFSRSAEQLEWAAARCAEAWGPIALRSPLFEFVETRYYEPTMGTNLLKTFWAFERLVDPGELPHFKFESAEWEAECRAAIKSQEERPLNLDPGYITEAKLVLASTKDHAHRIYLSQGIFAEVTLFYKHRRWQAHEWTFPDYQRADYQAFFTECRQWYRSRAAQERAT